MNTLLTVLTGVYVIGVGLSALFASAVYAFERSTSPYDDKATLRAAAKWLIGAPVWPVLVFRAVSRLIRSALADLREETPR